MIKNYLKIAWRNMLNNKVYSAINVVGLAAGMAVTLIIALWVLYQLSFDKFLPNYPDLYQVELNFTDPHEGEHTQQAVSLPIADVLRKQYPEVKYVAESDWGGSHDLLVGDKKLYMTGPAVGADFLKMFGYPLIKGNPNTVFKDAYSIVLTESTAKALFGDADPIDKMVRLDNTQNVKVTGVIKDVPKNSSIQFSYLLPFSLSEQTQDWMKNARTTYYNNSFQMYVQLKPHTDYTRLAPKIKDIVFKGGPLMRQAKPVVLLHPLKYWHLYSDFKNGKETGGFIDYVRMFSIIGILVLTIACINFVNLSTARSEKRAREVGIRKAIGSHRRDLIFQFLTESVLTTFIAFLLAVLITQLALPAFNTLTGDLIVIPFSNVLFWCIMVGYVLIIGLLAGCRPAFYLSSFNPVKVLKGSIHVGKSAALPRKILTIVQFTCSVALIISTVIVYQQIQYARNRPTGYTADRLVMTDMSDDLGNHYDALKNDLLQTGMIENVAKASSPLTGIYMHTGIEKWPGQAAGEAGLNVGGISVSDNYFKTVGMTLVQGHDFSSNWSSDTSNIIINEAAVKRMGLKNPIDQIISYDNVKGPARIIGVVKDALMQSPFTPVEPTVFNHGRGGNFVIYRLSRTAPTAKAIEKITKIFNNYNPAYPYLYQFVDDEYNQKFNLEVLVGKLAGVFAVLAIFISCLGLFGLAAYIAEQRNKEVGIRKVLGASVAQVWLLLCKDFIVLVIISCVIASPIAFYFLTNWLQKYNYRITIGPDVFVLSAVAALFITLATISFQSIKAAVANPVKSLRSE
jgi:putative ABC transport system permease protein